MTTKPFIDGVGSVHYRQGTGDGSEGDPFVPEYLESNSAARLTVLGNLLSALGDLATQATLAAAEDTLDSILSKLSSDPATQTTLEAVLAKLSSDPATDTMLAAVVTALGQTLAVSQVRPSSVQWASGTATASSQTVISAPSAGNQIAIRFVQLQIESSTAVVVTLLRGSGDSNPYRVKCYPSGGGTALFIPLGDEWLVGDETELLLEMDGTATIGYVFRYTVESV